MYKSKLFFLLIACLFSMQISLFAQNNTNSPYTRYGYGRLADQAFGGQRGMGGIGYGLRNPKMINPLNPASFSSVDSMTFMLDLGATGQFAWYDDNGNKAQKLNGNLEYVAMQFPLYKNLGMGLGFKPISFVGYEYGDVSKLNSTSYVSNTYKGTGGLNQVYGAFSYQLFKRLSLGFNVAYMFGDIKHDISLVYSDATNYNIALLDTLRSSGFTFDLGFQYVQPLDDEKRIILGGVYTPKTGFNGKSITREMSYNAQGQVITSNGQIYRDYGFQMPESYGIGVSYNKRNKMTLGADFLYQKWADAEFYSKTDTLKNRTKLNLGGEYIPNVRSRNFFQRMRYRAGAYYSDSYIKIQNSGYKEYGASLGLGLPMNDDRSFVNIAFEYSAIRPELKTLIDEQYFKFTFSYTFNELWFLKRKVQ